MTIQHRMDGAFGRDGNTREAAEEALSDFTSTPACVFALYVQDEVLHLKGKLMGVAIGAMRGGLGFPVNRLPSLSLHTTGLVVIHASGTSRLFQASRSAVPTTSGIKVH